MPPALAGKFLTTGAPGKAQEVKMLSFMVDLSIVMALVGVPFNLMYYKECVLRVKA